MNSVEIFEKILSHIDALLRYIAPGFVALFTLTALKGNTDLLQYHPTWAIIVLAALIGVTIYSLHTAVIVQVLGWVVIKLHLWKKDHSFVPDNYSTLTVFQVSFNLDTERWVRRWSRDERVRNLQMELDKWSAMLNFLYCSSYLLMLIPLYVMVSESKPISNWWHLFCIGVFMLFLAIISSFRIINRQFWMVKTYPQDPN